MASTNIPGQGKPGKSVSRVAPGIDVSILNTIDQAISDRHSTLTENERLIISLWIIHTYFYEEFAYTPYLQIASQNPGEGKSVIAGILRDLCADPLVSIPSVASLSVFKDVGFKTLIMEETHKILSGKGIDKDALESLICFGNQPGGKWMVSKQDKSGRVDLRDAWYPKAFIGVGISIFPEAWQQRTIRIIARKGTGADQIIREEKQKLRPIDKMATKIRTSLTSIARIPELRNAMHSQILELSSRTLNDGTTISDRVADIWRPFIIIADLINEEIGKRIRQIVSEWEMIEPEYDYTQADEFDSIFKTAFHSSRITLSNYKKTKTGDLKPPLPVGHWAMTNSELGWPAPRFVKDRLPDAVLVFNSETQNAELRFRSGDWKIICKGLNLNPRDVAQVYKNENRLRHGKGHSTDRDYFHEGDADRPQLYLINVSKWFWSESFSPQDIALVKIAEASIDEIMNADRSI